MITHEMAVELKNAGIPYNWDLESIDWTPPSLSDLMILCDKKYLGLLIFDRLDLETVRCHTTSPDTDWFEGKSYEECLAKLCLFLYLK